MQKKTPMLEQYFLIKKQHEDAILFFRLGDFYEMFGDDARRAHKILGVTLTARGRGTPNEIAMCGVPHHAAENYMVKLTRAGKKVALCEQVSPPGKTLVERKVVRIITPGTTISESVLDEKIPNYIVALIHQGGTYGFCIADVLTGAFELNEVSDYRVLESILFRVSPREVIILDDLPQLPRLQEHFSDTLFHPHERVEIKNPYEMLITHFGVKSLRGFGVEDLGSAHTAAALMLDYLRETQKTDLVHITFLRRYHYEDHLVLDETTIRNLELLGTLHDGSYEGSLLNAIDYTKTAMGGRLFRTWLLHPLRSKKNIEARLNAGTWLREETRDCPRLQKELNEMSDIERILGKIGLLRAHARDLLGLLKSLNQVSLLRNALGAPDDPLLSELYDALGEHTEVRDLLSRSIAPDPPMEITGGGMIRDGYNEELDSLRGVAKGGRQWIAEFSVREQKRTGINSLKVKFNKVFGYYIEISRANLSAAPSDYIRKQTLVNAERFITPELKEFEDKILNAEERIAALEHQLFLEIRASVAEHIPALQKTARAVASIDVLVAFALRAREGRYAKPVIFENGMIEIVQGRHPVIESGQGIEYIPNDARLDPETSTVLLITGPNMSGKSSYLRANALIVLMAQMGSFVPAQSASIALVDRIFTRVGASDNVSRGQSTFMVEMQETATILHNATEKSLIILDELGRGTSTYDGLSLAWAVLTFIHDTIGAKMFFATHYHELIEVVEKLARAKNYSIAVTEHQGQIIFLHKVVEGGTPDSYGIEVARLAGLPRAVISEAQKVLAQLESGDVEQTGSQKDPPDRESTETPPKDSADPAREATVVKKLRMIDPNSLTPLEALQKLVELKKEAVRDSRM